MSEQVVGEPGSVQAHQLPTPERPRQPGDRQVQQGNVVRVAVGRGTTRARVDRQYVIGVVAGRQVGAEPDPTFVGGLGVLLVRRGEHDGGIQSHHRDPGQLLAGDLQPGEPIRSLAQQAPPVPPERGHRRVRAGQLQRPDLRQGPPHRRGRCHRPDHWGQMPQPLEVTDRLTTQTWVRAMSIRTWPRS